MYGTVYRCFDSSENGLQTSLSAAKLHTCGAAYAGVHVTVSELG